MNGFAHPGAFAWGIPNLKLNAEIGTVSDASSPALPHLPINPRELSAESLPAKAHDTEPREIQR